MFQPIFVFPRDCTQCPRSPKKKKKKVRNVLYLPCNIILVLVPNVFL